MERDKRALKLSQARRQTVISRIKALYDVATQVQLGVIDDHFKAFEAKIDDLSALHKQFLSLHDDVIEAYIDLGDDIPGVEGELLLTVENHYYFCTSLARQLNINLFPKSVKQEGVESSIKLAPIKLPPFSGNLNEFSKYFDLYVSLYHNNANLSDIQKYHYFLSSLQGPALNLVKSIPFDSQHYKIAFDTFVNHYKNDKLLAMRYLDNIVQAKHVKLNDVNSLESFVNLFSENVSALKAMEIPNLDKFILYYLATRCVDSSTLQQFEMLHKNVKFPTADQLIDFSREYVNVLKSCQVHESKSMKSQASSSKSFHSSTPAKREHCSYCNLTSHSLPKCFKFKQLDVHERHTFVKDNKLCFLCLIGSHHSKHCKIKATCGCKSKHNILLCFKGSKSPSNSGNQSDCEQKSDDKVEIVSCSSQKNSNVLLSTVIVNVKNKHGRFIRARCLIDSGSMSSFCSSHFFKKLGLPKRLLENQTCIGVGGTPLNINNFTGKLSISPVDNSKLELITEVIVTSKISSYLPHSALPSSFKAQFEHLNLSDKLLDKPSRIDILIGANLYPRILCEGNIVKKGDAIAYPTIFGYTVTGNVNCDLPLSSFVLCNFSEGLIPDSDLIQCVSKFWQLENIPDSDVSISNPDDVLAEEQFRNLHFRSADGRYNAPILLKPNISGLGKSFDIARSRLLRLERSFKSPELKAEYNSFMAEYLSLGHMKQVTLGSGHYYIPHHAVIKQSSTTTKLRVVFDASCPTTSGLSLNDCVYSGPKLQTEIGDILLRFRFHKIALTADICKMYRMVNIIPEHRVYQHILFRFNDTDPVSEFELLTNSYGVTSAPFVALRAVRQLTLDEGHKFPHAVRVIPRDVFVDDLCSGEDSIDAAKHLVSEIVEMLASGGFTMRKWVSNEPRALAHLSDELIESNINFDKNESGVKVLGIHWNSSADCLSFHISPECLDGRLTKRRVLSITAKLFDPLGWVSPVVFYLKWFFQNLWKLGYDWDDTLEYECAHQWVDCVKRLSVLSSLSIPRYIGCSKWKVTDFQILAFCDASERGVAACVYGRCGSLSENGKVSLLISKTKLAPLKTLTIPRLELVACHLMKKLVLYVHASLSAFSETIPVFAFTDSSIVLCWLNTPPYKLKIFVAHRVSDIIQSPVKMNFCHVNSLENPADLACRGLTPCEMMADNRLWFNGPEWCAKPYEMWSRGSFVNVPQADLPEVKPGELSCHAVCVEPGCDYSLVLTLMDNISSYSRILRILAYVMRFTSLKNKVDRAPYLTSDELQRSLILCVKAVQHKYFAAELQSLARHQTCSKYLHSLCPFIDSEGVIRVGGRLAHSNLPDDAKHPVLLPKRSRFTELVTDYYHTVYLHVGPATLVSLLRRKFWVLSARSVVRQRIYRCVQCVKFRATTRQPLMGQLPEPRVVQSRVFSHVGVDCAGPFPLKEHKRKNSKVIKGYLVVFVCFAVKAVHLELVTELSTQCFLDAFDRFCSRRGVPSDVYSDCGTNFKGASRHFQELQCLISKCSDQIGLWMSNKTIKWHFNSPSAPSMGGLWEAAVKSAKCHLLRSLNGKSLTYEELSTFLHKAEAVLNSRPLTPVSSSPSEVDVLTPGHFLIGQPVVAAPEKYLLDEKEGLLKRWEYVRNLSQGFWRRWSADYLNILQQRCKWFNEVPNLSPGAVVLIKGENTSPTSWPLAQVVKTFPGKDSVVRVVELKVGSTTLRRPVNKLVLLPTCD